MPACAKAARLDRRKPFALVMSSIIETSGLSQDSPAPPPYTSLPHPPPSPPPRPAQVHRRAAAAQVARALCRRDEQRAAAIGDHAAFELVKRVGDHRRG